MDRWIGLRRNARPLSLSEAKRHSLTHPRFHLSLAHSLVLLSSSHHRLSQAPAPSTCSPSQTMRLLLVIVVTMAVITLVATSSVRSSTRDIEDHHRVPSYIKDRNVVDVIKLDSGLRVHKDREAPLQDLNRDRATHLQPPPPFNELHGDEQTYPSPPRSKEPTTTGDSLLQITTNVRRHEDRQRRTSATATTEVPPTERTFPSIAWLRVYTCQARSFVLEERNSLIVSRTSTGRAVQCDRWSILAQQYELASRRSMPTTLVWCWLRGVEGRTAVCSYKSHQSIYRDQS